MLTLENIEAMTPEERFALFDDMAQTRYQSTSVPTRFSAEFGYARQIYYKWRDNPNSIPAAVFFALERMNQTQKERDDLQITSLSEIVGHQEAIATKLAALAASLKG